MRFRRQNPVLHVHAFSQTPSSTHPSSTQYGIIKFDLPLYPLSGGFTTPVCCKVFSLGRDCNHGRYWEFWTVASGDLAMFQLSTLRRQSYESNILKIFEVWNFLGMSWRLTRDKGSQVLWWARVGNLSFKCWLFASLLRSWLTSGSFHTWVWWAPRWHRNGEGWYSHIGSMDLYLLTGGYVISDVECWNVNGCLALQPLGCMS